MALWPWKTSSTGVSTHQPSTLTLEKLLARIDYLEHETLAIRETLRQHGMTVATRLEPPLVYPPSTRQPTRKRTSADVRILNSEARLDLLAQAEAKKLAASAPAAPAPATPTPTAEKSTPAATPPAPSTSPPSLPPGIS